ncbi:hypothetical protein CCHR01_19904 [Colletotrichum chrysophilum]|uniref:Uncharacterized protein n=1 Tax=Colletotrichum chrysophilum TaxID=1836956 RepID=A0AAD8ZYV5_9PEZI|nr:hypothetical protein CCHR01_19904 [Colletotrichum chrysophilum]
MGDSSRRVLRLLIISHHHHASPSLCSLCSACVPSVCPVLSCPAHAHTPPRPSSDHFSHSTESLKRDGLRKHLQQHRSTRCNALTQLTLS